MLSFQTADIERDLAALRKLQQRTCSQLGDECTDQRARIQLCGPEPAKERGLRASGFVAPIANAWAGQVVRRADSSGGKRLGAQGTVAQTPQTPTGEAAEKVADRESVTCDPIRGCVPLFEQCDITSWGYRGQKNVCLRFQDGLPDK